MNLGKVDRRVRAGVGALILLIAFFAGIDQVPVQNVVGIIGSVVLLTALIGFCPFYFVFRHSTKEKPIKPAKSKAQKTVTLHQLYKTPRKKS